MRIQTVTYINGDNMPQQFVFPVVSFFGIISGVRVFEIHTRKIINGRPDSKQKQFDFYKGYVFDKSENFSVFGLKLK